MNMKYRYKVNDLVLYVDDEYSWWKLYKVKEIKKNYYNYKCIDCTFKDSVGSIDTFVVGCVVERDGIVVKSNDDYKSIILAKML